MKLKRTLLFITLISNFAFAQNTVKITNNYGSENREIQDVIDFENIYIERLNFEGGQLNGKYYEINIQEFVKGKLVHKELLFDGAETTIYVIPELVSESVVLVAKSYVTAAPSLTAIAAAVVTGEVLTDVIVIETVAGLPLAVPSLAE